MKKLILVRHAKSSWDSPHLDDFDRPLNPRGEKDAPEMAERFLKINLYPDLIITSGARRAYETASVFADKLKLPSEKLQINNSMFHASASTFKQIIRLQQEEMKTVMIFGHNPGLTDFANTIGDLEVENIPTSGIYAISYHGTWRNIDNKKWSAFYWDFPKNKK